MELHLKRFAVIGAGLSGISATKALLEQGFSEVTVFDRTDYIGGLWHYNPTVDRDGVASVMRSTVINTSKEMSAFSDRPPPDHYPNYMHNSLNLKYYESVADEFDFRRHVRFRHEVVAVEPTAEFERTGQWLVRFRKLPDQKEDAEPTEQQEEIFSEVFDGVAICVGHHNVPNVPTFQGQAEFGGRVVHTHSIKNNRGFEDCKVVVVGVGNSATDAAVELSTVAKQVYLSTRRGAWIFNRLGPYGTALDRVFKRRWLHLFVHCLLPFRLVCWALEACLNQVFDHALYGLRPSHRCLSAHISLNDSLPSRILCGAVQVRPDIDRLTKNGVVFVGETTATECDVLVLGTGYRAIIPFVSDTLLPLTANRCRLYRLMFVPGLDAAHAHTLAVIGQVQPMGATAPVVELQCRYYARLQTGAVRLPDRRRMEAAIDRHRATIEARFYRSDRHTFQVDWLSYMDELAEAIGCRPPLTRLLFTDPRLWARLVFGPALPYQYRLVGPNAWSGARRAIMEVEKRVWAPFSNLNSAH